MHINKFNKPVLIYFYGAPGSGKTFVSRQISELFGIAHISAEKIRHDLFGEARHDKSEIQAINQIMSYMADEFLKNGMSVIYDVSLSRAYDRKNLREMVRKNKAQDLLVWIQVDLDTCWQRLQKRDKRTHDDKYAGDLTNEQFEQYVRIMQPPNNEDYLVLSGKHLFNSQKQTIMRRLIDMNLINLDALQHKIPKPEMVNLVSRAQAQAGRVDYSRRSISIQ